MNPDRDPIKPRILADLIAKDGELQPVGAHQILPDRAALESTLHLGGLYGEPESPRVLIVCRPPESDIPGSPVSDDWVGVAVIAPSGAISYSGAVFAGELANYIEDKCGGLPLGFEPASSRLIVASLRHMHGMLPGAPIGANSLRFVIQRAILDGGGTRQDADLVVVSEHPTEKVAFALRVPDPYGRIAVETVRATLPVGVMWEISTVLPPSLGPIEIRCSRCPARKKVEGLPDMTETITAAGWWWAARFDKTETRAFCPSCALVVDAARQVLREALQTFHDEAASPFVFAGKIPDPVPSAGMPAYIVLRQRDDFPAEAIPYAELAPAREMYSQMAPNWTDTYLCVVAAGPGRPLPDLVDGISAIAAERRLQIASGFDAAHDDVHTDQALAWAAACYAAPMKIYQGGRRQSDKTDGEAMRSVRDPFPFSDADMREVWPRLRQLRAAGALCAAEIDRLLRLARSDAAK